MTKQLLNSISSLAIAVILGACSSQEGTVASTAAEPPPADSPAFELVLEADAFGTFQPVSNQLRDDAQPRTPHYSGFFAHLGTFKDAEHNFNQIQLTFADSATSPTPGECTSPDCFLRTDVEWIDVVCDEASPEVITPTEAAMFLPDPAICSEPNLFGEDFDAELRERCVGRSLHQDMSWKNLALLTIWQRSEGLSVKISSTGKGDHSHDEFVFSSEIPCEVRIWNDITSAPGSEDVFTVDAASTRVSILRIVEKEPGARHGSVHHPPWG